MFFKVLERKSGQGIEQSSTENGAHMHAYVCIIIIIMIIIKNTE